MPSWHGPHGGVLGANRTLMPAEKPWCRTDNLSNESQTNRKLIREELTRISARQFAYFLEKPLQSRAKPKKACSQISTNRRESPPFSVNCFHSLRLARISLQSHRFVLTAVLELKNKVFLSMESGYSARKLSGRMFSRNGIKTTHSIELNRIEFDSFSLSNRRLTSPLPPSSASQKYASLEIIFFIPVFNFIPTNSIYIL